LPVTDSTDELTVVAVMVPVVRVMVALVEVSVELSKTAGTSVVVYQRV
jgi:hypothetical protein